MEYVPNNKSNNRIIVSRTSSITSSPFSEDFRVVKGKVKVVQKTDKSTRWLDSTSYEIEMSEGSVVESWRVDMFSKLRKREYHLVNGNVSVKVMG